MAGSVSQFTIPRGMMERRQRKALGCPEVDTCCLSRSPSSSLSSSVSSSSFGSSPERKVYWTISDPFTHKRSPLHRESSYPCAFLENEHWPDPTTRAALSLPHLTKVTTPYGFVALSQSHQMINEEALLFQAGLWRLHKDEDSIHHRTQAIHIKPMPPDGHLLSNTGL